MSRNDLFFGKKKVHLETMYDRKMKIIVFFRPTTSNYLTSPYVFLSHYTCQKTQNTLEFIKRPYH